MKKATSLREISQTFRYNDKYLAEEDADFYEELYAKEIKKLAIDIENSQIYYDTFYITGQSGNGKSTAVNHLKRTNSYIGENYNVKHLFANDIFDFEDELNIVDVLLMIGFSLLDSEKALQEEYLEELEKLKDFHLGRLEESSESEQGTTSGHSLSAFAKGEVSFLQLFKFGADFKTTYNASEKDRTLIRKLFLPNRLELLNTINAMITKYNKQEAKEKLLLILDDLEKKNVSDEVFTLHRDLIEKIELTKIVMIPVNFATVGSVYKLSLRLSENPFGSDTRAKEQIAKNKAALEKLIYKRIDVAHQDLLPREDEILEKIIINSGGNIRQLLRLVATSGRNAQINDAQSIGKLDVEDSLQELLNVVAIGVLGKITFLKYIDKHHIPDENERAKIKESISENSIFAYFNGAPWYEVNPILKKYINAIKL